MAEPHGFPDPRRYNERSLFLFQLQNPLRKLLIRAIEWPWWDRGVLALIFLNTLQLAAFNPFDVPELNPDPELRNAMEAVGAVFTWLFFIEACCKVVAHGLIIGPYTYCRDPWNNLDLFIVVVSMMDALTPAPPPGSAGEEGSNPSALRSLRVMRPLRAVTKFPDLRFLTVLLLRCIPMLANVLGLVLFLFFVFGILGVQLFAGLFRGQCYNINDGSVHEPVPCTLGGGMAFAECAKGYECLLLGENPSRGIVHFDSIGAAIMTIYQIMTLEGWYEVMTYVQGVYHPALFIYFILIIILGPYFAVQLFLVVIASQHARTKESLQALEAVSAMEPAGQAKAATSQGEVDSMKKGLAARNRVHPSDVAGPREVGGRQGSTLGADEGHSGTSVVEAWGVNEISDKPAGAQDAQGASTASEPGGADGAEQSGPEGSLTLVPAEDKLQAKKTPGTGASPKAKTSGGPGSAFRRGKGGRSRKWYVRYQHKMGEVATSNEMQNFIMGMIIFNTLLMMIEYPCSLCDDAGCGKYKAFLEGSNLFFATVFTFEAVTKIMGLNPIVYFKSKANVFDFLIVVVSLIEVENVAYTTGCLWNTDFVDCRLNEYCPGFKPPPEGEEAGSLPPLTVLRTFRLVRIVRVLRAFPEIQKQVAIVVDAMGSVAALIALIAIFVVIFTILGMNLFGGKITAEWDPEAITRGAMVYVRFAWDDLGPAWVGRHAQVIDIDPQGHPGTPWLVNVSYGARVYATAPAARRDLFRDGTAWVTHKDLAGVGVPAITGIVPRFHFDDLGHSLVTNFQVLTTANWNDDLYDVVASVGTGFAVYFYAVIRCPE
jgi:hypothetical protein